MDVADRSLGQPRGEVGGHARADQSALVAADGVEGQRRAGVGHRHDVAVRHQTQLDERLEAVADAEHQAVAVLQQVTHGLGDGRRAEERGDELGGTVRLVAAGEAARNHHDLALVDLIDQRLRGFGDGGRCQVVDDQRGHVGAGALEGGGGIILAVVAREHRDHHMRLGHGRADVHGLLRRVEVDGLDGRALVLALGTVREHGFDAGLPSFLHSVQVQRLAGGLEHVLGGGGADFADLDQIGDGRKLGIVCQLDDERTICRGEQVVHGDAVVQSHADAVAERHLEQGFGGGAIARRGDGQGIVEVGELLDHGEHLKQRILVRGQTVGQVARRDAHDTVIGVLEFRGGGALHVAHGHGEGDQRRRHVEILERTGHGVLAADGAGAQVHLGHQCAEHGGRRLAPAFRLVAQLLEVLLEAQVGLLMLEAGRDQLGQRLDHGQVGAGELVLGHDVRVEAPRHRRSGGGLAEHRQLGDHGHVRGELTLAAERHEHGARADGGVEALRKALVGGHVDVGDQLVHTLGQRALAPRGLVGLLCLDMHGLVLGSAVGGQELTGQIHDLVAVPGHHHARVLGHGGDHRGLEVLFAGVDQELVHVLGGHVHGHALLGFGDGQLGAVQALVFLGHGVEVHEQAVGQLADRHGHATRAEVVAALDQTAGIAAAEQTLQLALHRSVALLHFGAVEFERFHVMRLGRTGGATDAVTAGAAAQQDDLVAGGRGFAAHMVGRSGGHDRTHLHALGHVAGVVDLVDLTGGQTDLVAVGAVAGCGGGHELALGELAFQRLGDRHGRVRGAGDAHRLIHVGAAGQRIADAAADAGGRAAERFDFGGVVVGLVLEQEQPVLVVAVHVNLDLDGAGVDFLGLVEAGQDAVLLEPLGADGAHVHEADGLGVAAELVAHRQVTLEGGLDGGVIDGHFVQLGAERGVTAVVGPVGVDHLDLGDGGFAALLAEVLLAEFEVGQIHGQTPLVDELLAGFGVHLVETGDGLDLAGHRHLGLQGFLGLQAGLAGLDRVDHVMLDGVHVGVGQVTFQRVQLGGADRRALALGDELDAFGGGVGALVELAGQELGGEDLGSGEVGQVVGHIVHLGFAEHGGHGLVEQFLGDAFDVIAVHDAQGLEAVQSEDRAQFARKLLGFDIKAGLLFHVHAKNHGNPFLKILKN